MADYKLSKTGPRIDDVLDNSARQDAIAIVSNGNTHIAINSGEYVYIKNHGTLSEGMYRATANIASNATLSTSNVMAKPKGAANDLKADIESLLKFEFVGTPDADVYRNLHFKDANGNSVFEMFVGNLDGSRNYLQFIVNGLDRGYIIFDTSRNVGIPEA